MRNINRVCLTGNLTRDPEVRTLNAGTQVCEFSVAVNGAEKVQGEWQDRPDFFDVVVYGRFADICGEHLLKGSGVVVDGRLRQDRWKNDAGETRTRIKVVGDQVQFINRPDKPVTRETAAVASDAVADTGADDDIPF